MNGAEPPLLHTQLCCTWAQLTSLSSLFLELQLDILSVDCVSCLWEDTGIVQAVAHHAVAA